MKILGVDTSTDILGLAITEDDNLICEARYLIRRAHAERLVAAIGKLLAESRLKLDDLDGIAISIGPGSFTGLRIGLAAIKGMIFDKDVAVAGVSSLEVFAHCGRFWEGKIRPLIRAQADEAYSAVYRFEADKLVTIIEPELISMNDLESVVEEKTLLIISGFKNYQEYLTPKVRSLARIASPQDSLISGFTVARLGWQKFKQGHTESIDKLEPFYLKEFKAKKKVGI